MGLKIENFIGLHVTHELGVQDRPAPLLWSIGRSRRAGLVRLAFFRWEEHISGPTVSALIADQSVAQLVAGRVPEHVGMHLDAQIGHDAGSFHHAGKSGRR